MSLLSPIAAILAAAVAVPTLLLLYFLKLRRQTRSVPTTIFWSQAVKDLHANAPFQRLRPSWLLLLQLILLLALIAALARPILGTASGNSSRIILLIDTSCSMSAEVPATPKPATRFELALRTASEIIKRLDRSGDQSEAMLIAVGKTARIIQPFTSDARLLESILNSLAPTDETANLRPALDLVEAFLESQDQSAPPSSEAASNSPQRNTRVILISDGRFADDKPLNFAGAESFEFIPIPETKPTPQPSDDQPPELKSNPDQSPFANVGLTAFSARRDYDDPTSVRVLCSLINSGPAPLKIPVRITLEDQLIDTKIIDLPEATIDGPGETEALFDLRNSGGGYLRAEILHSDILAVDNTAGLILTLPERSVALLVHPSDSKPDPYLTEILNLLDLRSLEMMPAQSFDAIAQSEPTTRNERLKNYELIIFDRVTPTTSPDRATISFHAALPIQGLSLFQLTDPQPPRRILSWDRTHPIMADVNLDPIAIADPTRLRLPERTAKVLALGSGGPVIALIEIKGIRHLFVSFDLIESNWPVLPSFAIFLKNAVEFLTMRGRIEAGKSFVPGEPVTITIPTPNPKEFINQSIHVLGPDFDFTLKLSDLRASDSSLSSWNGTNGSAPETRISLPPFQKAGLYHLDGAGPPDDRVVVNVTSRTESDLRPVPSINLGSRAAATSGINEAMPREVWRWFAVAALALLLLEWWLYTTRVKR